MPQSAGQANPVEQRPGERPVGPRTERHAEQHVFQAGEGGEQVEGLKNVAQGHRPHAVPARFVERGEVLACEPDTAGVGLEDAGDQMEQSRLAEAAFALERDLRPLIERETRHVDDGAPRAVWSPKGLLEV